MPESVNSERQTSDRICFPRNTTRRLRGCRPRSSSVARTFFSARDEMEERNRAFVECNKKMHASCLSADYRHGLGGIAFDLAGLERVQGRLVLGLDGNHRGKSNLRRNRRQHHPDDGGLVAMGESQGIRHLSAEREAAFPKTCPSELRSDERRNGVYTTALPTQRTIRPENGIRLPFPTPATIGPPARFEAMN